MQYLCEFYTVYLHAECFSVAIIDDNMLEYAQEDFQLLLSPLSGAVNLATSSMNISIMDNDRGRMSMYTISGFHL